MSKKKKFVQAVTSRDEDFARWYTDVVIKTDMVDYAPVKGCMVIKPYGYAIWENIQKIADKKFKDTGHENAYFPLLIPESFLKKESDHFEGFSPEVLWVTQGGDQQLTEKLLIRPTSETIICNMYSKWIQSYRDLPVLMNQWCNVIRWEKTTRPFLRTAEFLWQEGHTVHETEQEAKEEALRMHEIYRQVAEENLAMPVIMGEKSEREKFAGANKTYTIEAMMYDGKALQAGTSHDLGQNFAKMFDIKFLGRDGKEQLGYSTSWGISTRLIGGLVMVHGDDRGLKMPPRVAPIQTVIIPIGLEKEGVREAANEIYDRLHDKFRVKLDDREQYSPGWKFNEYEMKGIPVRLEFGKREIEEGFITAFRRDTLEKTKLSFENLEEELKTLLEDVQNNMFKMAKERMDKKTKVYTDYEELKKMADSDLGFGKVMWSGDLEDELKLKEETGLTIRCIPFEQEKLSDKCIISGKEAKYMVYVAKAY